MRKLSDEFIEMQFFVNVMSLDYVDTVDDYPLKYSDTHPLQL